MYTQTYMQTDRQTYMQTDRQTDRPRDFNMYIDIVISQTLHMSKDIRSHTFRFTWLASYFFMPYLSHAAYCDSLYACFVSSQAVNMRL